MAMGSMPRSRTGRLVASASIAASGGIVAVAQRDIHRRSDAEVRGSRWLWRLVCLNALGALAYFRWGRRPVRRRRSLRPRRPPSRA